MSEILIHTSDPLRGERRPGSVGPPLPAGVGGLDRGRGRPRVATGEAGAAPVRGSNIFAGYSRAPERNAAELNRDGWFRTGDLGRLGRDGYLTLVGRAKDLGEVVTTVAIHRPSAPGPDEAAVVAAACRAALADLKAPERALFADELPRNATGKVQKKALREAHAGLYGGAA